MSQRFDIVISGASFAGLALAAALSQASEGDLAIAVIDPVGEPRSGDIGRNPRAFAIVAASVNLLDALGVWPQVTSHAQPVLRIEISDTPLEAAVRTPILTQENLTRDGDPASYIVPDPVLELALYEAASAAPGVTIVSGRRAVSQGVAGASGPVEVELDDGRVLTASLLVAAEGRGSATRKRAGIGVVERDYGQDGICVRIGLERPHNATAVQHFLPGGPFAILPLRGDAACITWSETRAVARRLTDEGDSAILDALERRLAGRYGRVTMETPARSWPLSMHLARRFTDSRLALVADAARGVHPIAGQGLNLGFRDVAALAESVMDAARLGLDIGSPDVLARYERWRRFDSVTSSAAFDRLNGLFSNDWALLRSVREAGLGLVDRIPFLKQAFVTEAAGLAGDVPKLMRGELI